MPTAKQNLGALGERLVVKRVRCPGCKASKKTLKVLPNGFACADLICNFCGYLAQVKTKTVKGDLPATVNGVLLGASWPVQKERMDAGIYFSLYIVLVNERRSASIYFLPRDMQTDEMFQPRKRLSDNAKRKGWQGFTINFAHAMAQTIRIDDGGIFEFRVKR